MGRATSRCRHCDKEFTQPACRVWRDKFCSTGCGRAHRAAAIQQRVRKCATCGDDFRPRRIQVTKGQGRFCSQRCNTARLAALNSPIAQAASKATLKHRIETGVVVVDKGPKHWRWKGGAAATQARRCADGRAAATLRKYRKQNREKVSEWAQNRRRNGIGRVAKGAVARLREAQGDACAYCGAAIPPYHVDHKLPVSRGGTNVESNLHLTCPRCNLRKNDLTHEEFLVSKRRRVYKAA